MSDGNDRPKLVPPPRVTEAGKPGPRAGPGRSPNDTEPRARLVRFLLILVMAVGLIGVFVVLPRWQATRNTTLVTTEQEPTEVPPTETPIPAPGAGDSAMPNPAGEPSPSPAATATPSPIPFRPQQAPRTPPPSETDRRFVEAMSEGLEALENERWQAAHAAFEQASRLRPGAPEVADGLARARAGQRRESVADNLQRAAELERQESWREAERLYGSVLETDPESAPALAGHARAKTRADLDESFEFHIANPGRLSTPEVFDDASARLEEALEISPRGPRLGSQITRLEAALERASTPITVVLESDSLTEVMVYRVGRLGNFTRRELNLKPGAYTVVGSRKGYRDVRLQLVVSPDSPPKPLVVQCTERL